MSLLKAPSMWIHSLLVFTLQVSLAREPSLEATRAEWLRRNALVLETVEAEHGRGDLAGLKAMIGDARIVGLGEGTHGSREHFQLKHRLLEHLVAELGFSIFAIEANMPEAQELDAYVLGGDGDVNRLIGGMYFWTWNTEEVRDLVEWMRRFNAAEKARGSAKRVHFTGCDMQAGAVALERVRAFLAAHDRALADEHERVLDDLEDYDPYGSSQREFGCATARLPVAAARGKQVRLAGWIRTERLEDGFAGLWMRVDGPERRFDNMADRGSVGTSEWTELDLVMDVPESAAAIYFGLVMPGTGKAWFDGLRVEIDGAPWTSTALDLDFEGEAPKGLVAADPSGGAASREYIATFDASVAKLGRQSFRLERAPAQSPKQAELERAVDALVERMSAGRTRYAEAAGAEQAKWAVQDARVLSQWVAMGSKGEQGFFHRDRCMADNVAWLAAENPDAKIVVWAHNGHVSTLEGRMGSHLRERFGEDYVNVGFTSSRGTYAAVGKDGLGVHELQAPPPESFEAILEASGSPRLLVDLRRARTGDPSSAWLLEPRQFGGNVGARAMPEHYRELELREEYDLLAFVRESSPARQLATPPGRR